MEATAPELRERQLRGLVRRRPARDQLAPAVLEVLRVLLDDLTLACRRELERRQSGADFSRPVRHVRLPSLAARPPRTPPMSSFVVRAPVALQPSHRRIRKRASAWRIPFWLRQA